MLALVGLSFWTSLFLLSWTMRTSYTLLTVYLNILLSLAYLGISFGGLLPWKGYQNRICLTLDEQPEMEESKGMRIRGGFHSWAIFSSTLRERAQVSGQRVFHELGTFIVHIIGLVFVVGATSWLGRACVGIFN